MQLKFDASSVQELQGGYPDLEKFLERVEQACVGGRVLERGDVFVARAPGRLDVMGGISDYSGGLVLQMPIEKACFAAVQCHGGSAEIQITSQRHDGQESRWHCSTDKLESCKDYSFCREMFLGDEWAAYIAGCWIVLKVEGYLRGGIPGGRMFLVSEVPEGKGVSSSACVEVAAMKALVAALKLEIDDFTLALLCQKVENCVVGASCGIMDQMTAMMGQEGKLMKLLCQPCTLVGHVELPEVLTVIGVDSGERHSISGSDYSSVRTGTFMGLKILNTELRRDIHYLADLPAQEMETLESHLPDSLPGEAFLQSYGPHVDDATVIDNEKRYQVKLPTCHPIQEMARVQDFCRLLEKPGKDVAPQLGSLMHASHIAYQKLGLDSPWTNALYSLTCDATEKGIFGGKISGGGSGGTVCMLLSKEHMDSSMAHITSEFKKQRGCSDDPLIFRSSSNGAHHFGILHLQVIDDI